MQFTRSTPVTVVAGIVGACAAAMLLLACTSPSASGPDTAPRSSGPAAEVRSAVRVAADYQHAFPGVAVVVSGPGYRLSDAVGVADRATSAALTPSTPFRIASVTKTFTAAAILRLAEDRRIGLDDPIEHHLSSASVRVLRSDGYAVGRITVRMLLRHSAGLYDYATDPAYRAAVIASPRHRWNRAEQLRFAVEHGHPVAPPDTAFHYSDTGYILLGEMLERATGSSLGAAYRSLLPFDRIGLDHTYLESLEPPRGGTVPRAHQYLGDVDSFDLDPSFDLFGGGGLVSTLDDLNRFFRALNTGGVFRRQATLTLMRGAAKPTRIDDLGLGMFAVRLEDELCYGHQGFWGTNVTYCPTSRVGIASTVNQALDVEAESGRLHVRLHRVARSAGVSGRR